MVGDPMQIEMTRTGDSKVRKVNFSALVQSLSELPVLARLPVSLNNVPAFPNSANVLKQPPRAKIRSVRDKPDNYLILPHRIW